MATVKSFKFFDALGSLWETCPKDLLIYPDAVAFGPTGTARLLDPEDFDLYSDTLTPYGVAEIQGKLKRAEDCHEWDTLIE